MHQRGNLKDTSELSSNTPAGVSPCMLITSSINDSNTISDTACVWQLVGFQLLFWAPEMPYTDALIC